MKEVILLTGQTVYDLAVQEYGHTDGVFLLIEDNPSLIGEWGDVPHAGTKVLVRLEVPELSDDNKAIAAEFARREQKVVSGEFAEQVVTPTPIYVDLEYWDNYYEKWGNSRLKYLQA